MAAEDRLAELRARRAMTLGAVRRSRRVVKVPKQLFPRGVRLEYQRALLKTVREAADAIRDQVMPAVRRLVDQTRQTDPSARQDSPAGELADLLESVSETVIGTPRARAGITAMARNAVGRTADFNRGQLDLVFERTLGVGLPAAEPYLDDFILAATRENVQRISSLVAGEFAEAETVILSGFRRGLRFEEIARTLDERFHIVENRARLIARDQIASLNGELNRLRQTNLGVTSYIWRDSNDGDVRDSHEELDGEVFTWAEGSSEGHPGGPVNCFPGDTRIAIPDFAVRLFRRWYEGDLVVMQTEAGALRCTPNHPILTGRGWRAAKEIEEGDHIVDAALDSSGVGDHDRHEARFDEAWDLACGVGLRYARAGRFHGDASPDDQVDVVDIDRNLRVDRPTLCADCLEQLAFAESDEAGTSASLFQERGACAGTTSYGIVGGGGTRGSFRGGHPPLHCEHCLGAPPRFASVLDQPSHEHVSGDADLGGERLRRFPLGVSFRQLSEAPRRVQFRGHVFNLESAGHWYVADTTIVHNCRCTAEPVLGDLIAATDPSFV